jgi:hypothetical protein
VIGNGAVQGQDRGDGFLSPQGIVTSLNEHRDGRLFAACVYQFL